MVSQQLRKEDLTRIERITLRAAIARSTIELQIHICCGECSGFV